MKNNLPRVDHLIVIGMNRKDRRAFSKANGGIKIPGSNKPILNVHKNAAKLQVP